MAWSTGEPLTEQHRARLVEAGLDAAELAGLEYRRITAPLPDWWHRGGNALYLRAGFDLPERLVELLTTYPFAQALIVVGTGLEALQCLLVGGDRATVYVGPDSVLAAGEIYCGADSAVVLAGGVVATARAQIDARNGGSVVAQCDQLWAAGVYLATDDMHRLEDVATGARLNPYGAHIRLGRHVWLGREAVLTGDVEIGDGAVVGLRSLVRSQKVASRTAVAGTPARVIREGVTWRGEDLP
ncbi:MAG: hypothetical protein QM638_14935 [Nocardioides sp.]|uniref:acyltransferase n=1 Tax=Nocardioides sp. TaxID=35761 RepID=UPI0039E6795E